MRGLAPPWFVVSVSLLACAATCLAGEAPPVLTEEQYMQALVGNYGELTLEQRLAVATRAAKELSESPFREYRKLKDCRPVLARIAVLGALKAEVGIPVLVGLTWMPPVTETGRLFTRGGRTVRTPAVVALRLIGPRCVDACKKALLLKKCDIWRLTYLVASFLQENEAIEWAKTVPGDEKRKAVLLSFLTFANPDSRWPASVGSTRAETWLRKTQKILAEKWSPLAESRPSETEPARPIALTGCDPRSATNKGVATLTFSGENLRNILFAGMASKEGGKYHLLLCKNARRNSTGTRVDVEVDMTGIPPGDYLLYVVAPGHSKHIAWRDKSGEPGVFTITAFRGHNTSTSR